jgi:hypothetical protein
MKRLILILATLFLTVAMTGEVLAQSSRGTTQRKNYSAFRADDPVSILVVPAVNRSVEVTAPEYFLTTMAKPLAERGYYVFPIHLVKRILEEDGLADANLVHEADPTHLGELFGADAIMYCSVETWSAVYMILETVITVKIKYTLKSGFTGDVIWEHLQETVYRPSQSQSGGHPLANLIAKAIVAAVARAIPDYVPMARMSNQQAFATPGSGLPSGPYHVLYQQDQDKF